MKSERFELNSVDWKSIGIGALKAVIGALLAYFTKNVFPTIDWGQYAVIAVPVWSIIANIAWKFVDGK
jgi:hypothetical protein